MSFGKNRNLFRIRSSKRLQHNFDSGLGPYLVVYNGLTILIRLKNVSDGHMYKMTAETTAT